MSWICDCCNEEYNYRNEVVFLCGNIIVDDEENGGSGDIDRVVCSLCYERGV